MWALLWRRGYSNKKTKWVQRSDSFQTKALKSFAQFSWVTRLAQGDGDPFGKSPLKWGEVNRLARKGPMRVSASGSLAQSAESAEEVLVENVIGLAGPTVFADAAGDVILFVLHDTEKPWYAATDIAEVMREGSGSWAMDRVTDDLAAEFSPELTAVDANTLLSAWTRVEGGCVRGRRPRGYCPSFGNRGIPIRPERGQLERP